ncbi:MAG: hypothetical protein HeimC3_09390 [Candidatus Heimdallarchaeota archaeon LC_3]|nr:MAG: hypothetical protein HeimC3_09390 [Candidatus Heimdallarchaeota archaeon LC_3]
MQNIDLDLLAHGLSLLFFLSTTLIAFSLYKELKDEKYWIGFPIGMGFLFLHELFETFEQFFQVSIYDIGAEISEIIGAFFIMYASFGLRNILLNVKKTMNEENSDFDLDE